MKDYVEIFEVGPRDGLQNEAREISVEDKIALVDCLSGAGFRRIEVASFVHPKWVPQMADSGAVLAGISRAPDVSYAALTPNMKGFQRAMEARASEIAIFGAASEGFSRANINKSIAESLDSFAPIAKAAKAANIPMRGYVSCVVDCPYDGPVAPEQAAKVAQALYEMGCYEVSLGDTIGRGTPKAISALLEAVKAVVPVEKLAGHYHDTNGQAIDNIAVSIDAGVRVFDAAVGGLGGCPYAPGAAGNVATEKVAHWLDQNGHKTLLDMDILKRAAGMARAMRGDNV